MSNKVLALYDSHYPHHLDLAGFNAYAKDFQPDVFILGGDNWSLDCISHWNDADFKNIGFDNIQKQLRFEAQGFQNQLDTFRKLMPKAQFVYITGNHEDWLKQFATKYPQMNDLTLETLLNLIKRKIYLVKLGGFYRVGKIYFAHGDQFGSENPAKQAVMRCHHTVVFGHHHNHIVWSDFSMVNSQEKHLGILVPCYCGRGPAYIQGRPNRWMNGFFYAHVKPSGNFSCGVQLVSSDGHFVTQAGKEYK